MIKKQGDKRLCDIQPGGRGGRRYRKNFDTKADALRFERSLAAKVQNDSLYRVPVKDLRSLSDLIQLWYNRGGT